MSRAPTNIDKFVEILPHPLAVRSRVLLKVQWYSKAYLPCRLFHTVVYGFRRRQRGFVDFIENPPRRAATFPPANVADNGVCAKTFFSTSTNNLFTTSMRMMRINVVIHLGQRCEVPRRNSGNTYMPISIRHMLE